MTLARALKALEQGDSAGTHIALAEAWRARRAPATAELAGLAHARSPAPMEATLATLAVPRVAPLVARLIELEEVDDPIFATWVLAALETPPFMGPSSRPLIDKLLDIAERLADARLIERAPTIARVWEHRVTPKPSRVALTARLEKIVEAMNAPPPPSAEEAALEEAIAQKLRAVTTQRRTEADLVADVYANPADDGPRLVLADFLLERGDPRGELITLQLRKRAEGALSPEGAAREAALLKKHGKAWLGPLAAVLTWGKSYSKTTFERGFVGAADIMLAAGKKLELVMNEPLWSVVEELRGTFDWTLYYRAPLHGLRRLELAPEPIRELANRGRVFAHVEHLETDGGIETGLVQQVFPALRELVVDYQCGPTVEEAKSVIEGTVVPRVVFRRWAGDRVPAAPIEELVRVLSKESKDRGREIAIEPVWPRWPRPALIELGKTAPA